MGFCRHQGSLINVYEYIKTNLNKRSPLVKKLRVYCAMTCLMWDTRSHPQVAGFVAEKWPSSLEALLSFLSEGPACVMGLLGVRIRALGTVSIVGR